MSSRSPSPHRRRSSRRDTSNRSSPPLTRSRARALSAASAASAQSSNSTSLNPFSASFFPSQRSGDTHAYHTDIVRSNIAVSRQFGRVEPQDRRTLSNVDVSSQALDRVKNILNKNIKTMIAENRFRLEDLNNIYSILSDNELSYLTFDDTILSNFYQRRYEFTYTINLIEDLNSLTDIISIDMNNIRDDIRHDINYYYLIKNIISDAMDDYQKLNNRSRDIAENIREIQKKISKEKVLLNNLINSLNSQIEIIDNILTSETANNRYINYLVLVRRFGINQLIDSTNRQELIENFRDKKQNYETFRNILQQRLDDLNFIREAQLRTSINIEQNRNYQMERKKLLKIMKSALILLGTFKNLIINIGVLRNIDDIQLKNLIISDMVDSIELYMNTISSINDEDIYKELLETQINFYKNITDCLSGTDFRNYLTSVSNFIRQEGRSSMSSELRNMRINYLAEYHTENIINQSHARILRQQRQRERVEEEQRIRQEARRIRAEERDALIRQRLLERSQARAAALSERSQRRAAALLARRQANDANRAARGHPRRGTRPIPEASSIYSVRVGLPPQARNLLRTLDSLNISFDDTDYKIDPELVFTERSIRGIDTSDYITLLNDVKDKFSEQKLIIKPDITYQTKLKENYKKLINKYSLKFNIDEPVLGATVPSIKNFVGNSIISLFARYMRYDKDMKFCDKGQYYVFNINLTKDGNNFTEERQMGIDAGGLRRDFISSLLNELFEKKIFISRAESTKYFLNPEFELDDYMKYIIKNIYINGGITDSYFQNDFTKDFYNFIGQLIAFILVNDCGLDKYLSSYYIYLLCNRPDKEITDEDYIAFMIEDFPSDFNLILNLMKIPDQISGSFMSFNDFYLLDESEEDRELDENNIIEYLKKYAKFMMTKTILRKDVEISSNKNSNEIFERGETITKYFIEGIPQDIRKDLSNNKYKPSVINKFIKTPDMSPEIITQLIDNLTNSMRSNPNYRNNNDLQKLTRLFIDYVLKNNHGKHSTEENYFKFIINLLKFWSGLSFYKRDGFYKLQINEVLGITHLPQSHTCFFLIDLPNYTRLRKPNNEELNDDELGNILFDKVNLAISNVETGIGLAGGGFNNRNRRLRNKYRY